MKKHHGSQHIIRQGMRWRVGNGRKVRIWSDRWLLAPTLFKVMSPQNTLDNQVMVGDHQDASGGSSDSDIYKEILEKNMELKNS